MYLLAIWKGTSTLFVASRHGMVLGCKRVKPAHARPSQYSSGKKHRARSVRAGDVAAISSHPAPRSSSSHRDRPTKAPLRFSHAGMGWAHGVVRDTIPETLARSLNRRLYARYPPVSDFEPGKYASKGNDAADTAPPGRDIMRHRCGQPDG